LGSTRTTSILSELLFEGSHRLVAAWATGYVIDYGRHEFRVHDLAQSSAPVAQELLQTSPPDLDPELEESVGIVLGEVRR